MIVQDRLNHPYVVLVGTTRELSRSQNRHGLAIVAQSNATTEERQERLFLEICEAKNRGVLEKE